PTSTSNEKHSCVSSEINAEGAFFPSLIQCDKPIDSLLNILYDDACPISTIEYFHSISINTIGDLARATAVQIETYPIPSPKLTNIQNALSFLSR
ncbi:unnamed protein product, partial [Rotaria socialis]